MRVSTSIRARSRGSRTTPSTLVAMPCTTLVHQRHHGVRPQDLRLGTHDLLLPLVGVALVGGVRDGLVDGRVLQTGDVVDTVAGEVTGEVGDRVAGVEEGDAGEDQGVVLAGQQVGLHLRVLADVLLDGEAGLLQLLLQHACGLGEFGAVGVGGQAQRPTLGLVLDLGGGGGLGPAGHGDALVGGVGDGGPEQPGGVVGEAAEHRVDQRGSVDGGAGCRAQRGVGEDAAAGVEDQAVAAHRGHFVAGVLVQEFRLRGGDPLGDVHVTAAQRVGAGGAVGDPPHVDPGGLGPAAPVAVVAVEGGLGLAAQLLDLEGSGAGPDRADRAVLRVRLRGEDAQRGAGEPQRQHRVGALRADLDGVGVHGVGRQRDIAEHARLHLGGARMVERGHDRVRGDLGAVLEGCLAQFEGPGIGAVLLPGLRERGRCGAVLVEGGEALRDGELVQHRGVVAVRRKRLHRRDGQRHLQPAARTPGGIRRVTVPRHETAGQQRGKNEHSEQPAGSTHGGDRVLSYECGAPAAAARGNGLAQYKARLTKF